MSVDVTLPNGVVVRRVQIIGTNCYTYSSWVPCEFRPGEVGYSTITTIGDKWYGQCGTEPLPAELEALTPGSTERINAVYAWIDQQYAAAHQHIYEAFPALRYMAVRDSYNKLEYYSDNPA